MFLGPGWIKKEASLYLMDLAILLSLLHGINLDFRSNTFNWNNGPKLFSHMELYNGQLPEHSYANNLKVHRLLTDLRLENKTDKRWDGATINVSAAAPQHLRNFTVSMVLVSSVDLEDDLALNHSLPTFSERETSRDGFNLDNMQALQSWNISNNISEAADSNNNFTNSEDVRWQQFLNIDSTETSSRHCDSSSCTEKDISKSESFNAISSSFTFSGPSTSKDTFETLDLSDIFSNSFDSITATELIPSTSNDKGISSQFDHPHFSANATGEEDADLMQMLYEQDADLGYNNWQQNAPLKQLKEVDNIQKVKNDLLDVNNFFIDGETGEQIPIPPNQVSQQQAPALSQYQASLNCNTDSGNNGINLEECLEILEHSIDDMGPREVSSQTSVVERNNMVRNLTSLMDSNGNASMQTPNADLWQQIDELSEMTGLNLREVEQPVMQQSQNEMNGNFNYNGQIPAVEARSVNQQLNYNNSVTYNGIGQVSASSPSYGAPVASQAFPVSSFPTQRSPVPADPSYMSPPIISDDGVPMDTTFSPMGSPDKQEPSFPVNNFNNFNYDASSIGEGNPALSSLPEPGQSFFDYLQPESSVSADFAPATSAMTSFSTQANVPFMNPPVASYPPPPLNPSTSSAGFIDMSSTVDKNAIMESYESDSGISLDQSPQGLEFLTLTPTDEAVFNADLSMIKTEPDDQDQGFLPDLKAVNHNHTYNGTAGVKKQEKHKAERSSHTRESRDEKKARELNLPFSLDEIILSPVEEYNEMLARTPLNPAQQTLIKDIRRRGKNKVAAQNCRKRKIETISNMEEDVELMRSKKQSLLDEQKDLEVKYENMKLRYSSLYQQIFSSLRDDTGRPYDPSHYRLEQVEGAVLLVPSMGQGESTTEDASNGADMEFSKVKMEKH